MMNNLDALLDLAFSKYNASDFDTAERYLREALILSPTHGDALYLLGLIAYQKGVIHQAIEILTLVVKLYPKQQQYHLALAEVYQKLGDLSRAKKIYSKYTADIQVQEQLGWIALAEHKRSLAKQIFMKLKSTNRLAHAYHGLAILEQGSKRLNLLKKAFKIEKSPTIAKDLANFYLSKKQSKQALTYLSYILDEPTIARIYMANHQYQQALDVYEKYLKKNTNDASIWENIAQCHEKLKNLEFALSAYQTALTLDKKSYLAHYGCARLFMKQKNLPMALEHYQFLVQQKNDDCPILFELALLQENIQEYSEALGLYFHLLTLGYRGIDRHIKHCILELYKSDRAAAKRFLKGWIKHFPKSKMAKSLQKIICLLFLLMFGYNGYAQTPSTNDEKWENAWLIKMAQYQNPESEFQLAHNFEVGNRVPKDLKQAIFYYELSAKHNYLPAALKLATLYGENTPVKNDEKSIQWYTFAANHGETQAQLYLGQFYLDCQEFQLSKKFYDMAFKTLFPTENDYSKVSPHYQELIQKMNRNSSTDGISIDGRI